MISKLVRFLMRPFNKRKAERAVSVVVTGSIYNLDDFRAAVRAALCELEIK